MTIEDLIGMVLISLISYLIGSISFATIFSKKIKGIDPREHGSHNPGATNVLRTAGIKAAILTLLFDLAKGIIVVLFAVFLSKWTNMNNGYILPQLAAFFVIFGHMFPVYYKFKGGKGIATGIGVIFVLNWQIGLIVLVFALLVMLLSRYVSLGSISGAVLYFVLTIFLIDANIVIGPRLPYILNALLIASLIIFKHKDNIQRLRENEENKISFRKERIEEDIKEKTE